MQKACLFITLAVVLAVFAVSTITAKAGAQLKKLDQTMSRGQ